MNENQIDHDRLFKELLETFFAEFMELFFPEASRAIDLTQLKFLQQEVFTDVTAGEKRKVDILVETRLKGAPGLILVHVEPQAYVQRNFNERMFIYFSRLYEKFRRKILPVAVFSYDWVRDEPDSFELTFPFLDVLNFRFYKLELKKLNWREYIQSDNPVAAALLSKMGFKPEEKVKVKLEFMRMVARMKLDPARMELLAGFFETYLKLNREEEEQYNRELGKLDSKEVGAIMQITTSWHEKGRAEGRAEGRVERTREIICKYLARKFGKKSADLQQKVQEMTSLEELDYVLEELFAATTLEEARTIINDGAGKFLSER
ncbi:Rpn family recombination-promoting nuclease/putative transposase [Desulfofundulus thermosubterraneus]|uniref:Transposase (putative) YhgA-like domain-containing protein n=1 Tax=Desulfofundulus thermosubterraneus DSM 16057 TaxID=1121432 RepID=A0A1M6ITM2_9FIRM|nr:Rpn family recombination-promoting nuclease/putative transposase [Desulfofundulus thermosubterraneus]SHJ37764.1 conserved hypothetical protein (putative transposase or invertase) [Desulfofundulus thermosubterraneus DSM 16057]